MSHCIIKEKHHLVSIGMRLYIIITCTCILYIYILVVLSIIIVIICQMSPNDVFVNDMSMLLSSINHHAVPWSLPPSRQKHRGRASTGPPPSPRRPRSRRSPRSHHPGSQGRPGTSGTGHGDMEIWGAGILEVHHSSSWFISSEMLSFTWQHG